MTRQHPPTPLLHQEPVAACAPPLQQPQEVLWKRHETLEIMGELKLAVMRHAYDEVMADAMKRQHSAQRHIGDLLKAEITEM